MQQTVNWLVAYFLIAIVLDHAHLVSPIGLAWTSAPMRRKMIAEWSRYILLPSVCLSVAVVVGLSSSSTHVPAFQVLAGAYFLWNTWHFSTQHWGISQLLGWRTGSRRFRQAVTIGPTVAILMLPLFLHVLALVVLTEAISFLHWLTDIGLSVWRKARWWMLFLGVVLCIGVSGFLWKTVSIDPRYCGRLSACTAVYSIPVLLGLRYGLGFVHFLYSRWVWQSANMQLMRTA